MQPVGRPRECCEGCNPGGGRVKMSVGKLRVFHDPRRQGGGDTAGANR
jgi:hypothetical protein